MSKIVPREFGLKMGSMPCEWDNGNVPTGFIKVREVTEAEETNAQFVKECEQHWKIYGYEKQHYLVEIFERVFRRHPHVGGIDDLKGTTNE